MSKDQTAPEELISTGVKLIRIFQILAEKAETPSDQYLLRLLYSACNPYPNAKTQQKPESHDPHICNALVSDWLRKQAKEEPDMVTMRGDQQLLKEIARGPRIAYEPVESSQCRDEAVYHAIEHRLEVAIGDGLDGQPEHPSKTFWSMAAELVRSGTPSPFLADVFECFAHMSAEKGHDLLGISLGAADVKSNQMEAARRAKKSEDIFREEAREAIKNNETKAARRAMASKDDLIKQAREAINKDVSLTEFKKSALSKIQHAIPRVCSH